MEFQKLDVQRFSMEENSGSNVGGKKSVKEKESFLSFRLQCLNVLKIWMRRRCWVTELHRILHRQENSVSVTVSQFVGFGSVLFGKH